MEKMLELGNGLFFKNGGDVVACVDAPGVCLGEVGALEGGGELPVIDAGVDVVGEGEVWVPEDVVDVVGADGCEEDVQVVEVPVDVQQQEKNGGEGEVMIEMEDCASLGLIDRFWNELLGV